MIFPIGDDQVKGGHFPILSYSFIVINILVYLFQASLDADAYNNFILAYGAIPKEIMAGEDSLTLFSSMFMHGSWMHLIGNLFFLWIFADNIEATIGSPRFLIFYILGGLAAHAGHIYFNMNSGIPTVGASGAISAVMGAYLILFPTSKIKTLIFFYVTRIPAFIFLLFWIGQQLWASSTELQSAASDGAGVAWWAHIGGFAFGVLAGLFFRNKYGSTTDFPSQAGIYKRDELL